jgi:hypothetical protein
MLQGFPHIPQQYMLMPMGKQSEYHTAFCRHHVAFLLSHAQSGDPLNPNLGILALLGKRSRQAEPLVNVWLRMHG